MRKFENTYHTVVSVVTFTALSICISSSKVYSQTNQEFSPVAKAIAGIAISTASSNLSA